jgi:hypothetical protein
MQLLKIEPITHGCVGMAHIVGAFAHYAHVRCDAHREERL